MDTHTKELEYLLNNYWCVKEENPKEYFQIKNNLDYYKDFIQTKLGSRLIVNDRFIKLEKIPAIPKSYMGLPNFTDTLEYSILMIILLFLEDKPKLEQFILSNLIDFITNTATTLELNTVPNWNILHHRKRLVNVINHLKELNIIRVVEESNLFTEDASAEALYETTGLSNYYVREFKNNILEYHDLNDYVTDEFTNQDDSIGDVRRYRVYRHLMYSLASFTEDLNEAEIDYLRKFRSSIQNELNKYTSSELELTKNMAVLLYDAETREKFDFPNNKAISDIVLLVNYNILDKVEKHTLTLNQDETITISKEQLSRIIKEVKQEYLSYFSKFYREMPITNFINEVTSYMMEYDFLREFETGYKIYPIVSKLVGYISKETREQLDLFGGTDNE
ncbi:MAG: TIGR02678 family protein [Erysipelotrichaceae bacterium]|nr:TIGR02678 family protein [Erysipelotrichaceae bacterium]